MKLTKNAIDDLNIEVSLSIEPSDYAEGKKKKLVDIRRNNVCLCDGSNGI